MKKHFTPREKAQVAVAAIKGEKTTAEIARLHSVHPTQVGFWKRRVLTGLEELFTGKTKPKDLEKDELIEELYKQIGQLKVESEWLKKKLRGVDAL